MLVRRSKTGDLRLLMIELDPWKHINREEPFDEPETVFEFSESVSKASDYFDYPRHFSGDKIRDI